MAAATPVCGGAGAGTAAPAADVKIVRSPRIRRRDEQRRNRPDRKRRHNSGIQPRAAVFTSQVIARGGA